MNTRLLWALGMGVLLVGGILTNGFGLRPDCNGPRCDGPAFGLRLVLAVCVLALLVAIGTGRLAIRRRKSP